MLPAYLNQQRVRKGDVTKKKLTPGPKIKQKSKVLTLYKVTLEIQSLHCSHIHMIAIPILRGAHAAAAGGGSS